MKVLFLCNQGENRSRTAAEIFSKKYETKYAGLYSFDKSKLLTDELLNWCDAILVMQKEHIEYLAENKPAYYLEKRVVNLEVPDIYDYNNEELIKILKQKAKPVFRELEELI